mmetsp:Transcript_42393/g.91046  ORF Transcript_42393/g.91046 Transcript_42393/m.91046 type:complete len:215 (-) Transcript_42393:1492-2136(-)
MTLTFRRFALKVVASEPRRLPCSLSMRSCATNVCHFWARRPSASPARASSNLFVTPSNCSSSASARAPWRTRSAWASSRRCLVSSRRFEMSSRSWTTTSRACNFASNSTTLAPEHSRARSSSACISLAFERNSSASLLNQLACAVAAPWASSSFLAFARSACKASARTSASADRSESLASEPDVACRSSCWRVFLRSSAAANCSLTSSRSFLSC